MVTIPGTDRMPRASVTPARPENTPLPAGLIEALIRGNPEACGQLLREFVGPALKYARKVAFNRHQGRIPEDDLPSIVHAAILTFCKVEEATTDNPKHRTRRNTLRRLDGWGAFTGLILRTTHHKIRERERLRRRVASSGSLDPGDGAEGPFAGLVGSEERVRFRTALSKAEAWQRNRLSSAAATDRRLYRRLALGLTLRNVAGANSGSLYERIRKRWSRLRDRLRWTARPGHPTWVPDEEMRGVIDGMCREMLPWQLHLLGAWFDGLSPQQIAVSLTVVEGLMYSAATVEELFPVAAAAARRALAYQIRLERRKRDGV